VLEYTLLRNFPAERIQQEPSVFSLEYTDPDTGKRFSEINGRFRLLFPPFLLLEQGRYEILQGRMPVEYCKEQGIAVPHVLIVRKEKSDDDFLRFLLHLKKESVGFNIIEKALAVRKFDEMTPGIPEDLPTLLDIPRNKRYMDNYKKLSSAPDEIRLAVLRGELHENTAFEIFRFPQETWCSLGCFFSGLSTGTKKRNEILDMLLAITDGEKERVERILRGDELRRIFKLGIDPPQIAQKIFEYVKEMRYPQMAGYRKQFDKKLKQVKLDRGVQLIVPKDFEEWEFTMNLSFSTVEELKNRIEGLKKIVQGSAFSELMSMRV
jgi:hypothetical protein